MRRWARYAKRSECVDDVRLPLGAARRIILRLASLPQSFTHVLSAPLEFSEAEPAWTDALKAGTIPVSLFDFYRAASFFNPSKTPQFLDSPNPHLFAFMRAVMGRGAMGIAVTPGAQRLRPECGLRGPESGAEALACTRHSPGKSHCATTNEHEPRERSRGVCVDLEPDPGSRGRRATWARSDSRPARRP